MMFWNKPLLRICAVLTVPGYHFVRLYLLPSVVNKPAYPNMSTGSAGVGSHILNNTATRVRAGNPWERCPFHL